MGPVGFPGGSVVKNCLMQKARIQSLVQEDPTRGGATKPIHHNYWACALEATNCKRSHRSENPEPYNKE